MSEMNMFVSSTIVTFCLSPGGLWLEKPIPWPGEGRVRGISCVRNSGCKEKSGMIMYMPASSARGSFIEFKRLDGVATWIDSAFPDLPFLSNAKQHSCLHPTPAQLSAADSAMRFVV